MQKFSNSNIVFAIWNREPSDPFVDLLVDFSKAICVIKFTPVWASYEDQNRSIKLCSIKK